MAWIGGILSTILLVISGYIKDKDFSGEKKDHLKVADDLWPIREDYISLLTDLDELDESVIEKKRDDLKNKTAKVYSGAIQTDARSYKAAQDLIKNKEHQFFTREELNKMLPVHLRRN